MRKEMHITQGEFLNQCEMTIGELEDLRDLLIGPVSYQKLEYCFLDKQLAGKVIVTINSSETVEKAEYLITNNSGSFLVELCKYSITSKNSLVTCALVFFAEELGHVNYDTDSTVCADVYFCYQDVKVLHFINDLTTEDTVEYAKHQLSQAEEYLQKVDFSMLIKSTDQCESSRLLPKFEGICEDEQDNCFVSDTAMENVVSNELIGRRIGNGWCNIRYSNSLFFMDKSNKVTSSNDSLIYNVNVADANNSANIYDVRLQKYCKEHTKEYRDRFYGVEVTFDEQEQKYYLQLIFEGCEVNLLFPINERDEEKIIKIADENLHYLVSERYEEIETALNQFFYMVRLLLVC